MTRNIRMLVTLFIALGTLGLGASSASAAGGQVPFWGYYAGTAAFTSATTVSFSGTGVAKFLLLSANKGQIEITGPDSSCPGGLANVNTETLTAASGDSLTLTMNDVSCPTSDGVFHGTGHWVVTGGTGRFSGATGQGASNGGADFNQGVFHFQLTGTISEPRGR
jgi:hypothetical protein